MLTPRQKAAVIVRLLNAEGMTLPLQELSDEQQTLLTGQIAQMRPIDRDTLNEIIEEFCTQLESIGLTFPKGLDGALTLLDGQLSTTAASRLRRMISNSANSDPWQRIAGLAPEVLEPAILEESPEVAAVILSKLPVPTAAEILGKLPGEKARRIAYAVSLTGNVAPEVVQRIGMVLAQQLDVVAAKAFTSGPVERVGAILNQSPSRVRDSVIEGLEEEDRQFAEQVRKAIFTFALIPQRIEARDVPKILRGLDQKVILTALASATGPDAAAAEFIFANISQRLAATLREEMEQLGKIRESEGEAARAQVVAAARDLEAAGELAFVAPEDE
ncbi:flagellar motor switch protein FliG [Paenirhodobacter populi]|uniref:Flagellar motor switch protein FliG n=1 Tax=Paenirhodobacter populi TaxID=2306993 RepID=A0A443JJU0_9RHOB|nr:FliG C-terminal domain-containing protein [Sinirhodobacter populi]RWR20865.1 flagellar motor switch protein FliG [Sinirhodobacter populi]